MRAFLYARVSTGEQNEGMQLREMLEYAQHFSGIQVAEILVTASAGICQNPLHTCCDGSARPHVIGSSCMAEPSEEKS